MADAALLRGRSDDNHISQRTQLMFQGSQTRRVDAVVVGEQDEQEVQRLPFLWHNRTGAQYSGGRVRPQRMLAQLDRPADIVCQRIAETRRTGSLRCTRDVANAGSAFCER